MHVALDALACSQLSQLRVSPYFQTSSVRSYNFDHMGPSHVSCSRMQGGSAVAFTYYAGFYFPLHHTIMMIPIII
jgi:hypothetical protein